MWLPWRRSWAGFWWRTGGWGGSGLVRLGGSWSRLSRPAGSWCGLGIGCGRTITDTGRTPQGRGERRLPCPWGTTVLSGGEGGAPGEEGVEGVEVVGGGFPVGGGGVGADLVGGHGAGDDGADGGLGGEAGDGDGEEGLVAFGGVFLQGFEAVEQFVGEEGAVGGAVGEAGSLGDWLVAVVFAGEEAVGEGEVGQQADAIALAGGDDVVLGVALEEAVVVLGGDVAGAVFGAGDPVGFDDLPAGVVGGAGVADLALGDEVVEGGEGLLDGGVPVGLVLLVEVDVVGLEAAEAG